MRLSGVNGESVVSDVSAAVLNMLIIVQLCRL